MSEMSDYRDIVGPDGKTGLQRDMERRERVTYPQRDTPSDYSVGLEKGIDHAVSALRRALTGQDDGIDTYANPNLERLRRDILELRAHVLAEINNVSRTLRGIGNDDVPEIARRINPEPARYLPGSYELGSGGPVPPAHCEHCGAAEGEYHLDGCKDIWWPHNRVNVPERRLVARLEKDVVYEKARGRT